MRPATPISLRNPFFGRSRVGVRDRMSAGDERDSNFAIVNQSPSHRTLITQPEVLDGPLLLTGRDENSRDILAGPSDPVDFHQKELTFSQFKKGLTAL